MEVAAQGQSDAQGDGNRGEKQVGHFHHHLQQTQFIARRTQIRRWDFLFVTSGAYDGIMAVGYNRYSWCVNCRYLTEDYPITEVQPLYYISSGGNASKLGNSLLYYRCCTVSVLFRSTTTKIFQTFLCCQNFTPPFSITSHLFFLSS